MNSPVPKRVLTLGLALTLGACAAMPDFHARTPEYTRLARIHPGLTQADVRALAGEPATVAGNSRSTEKLWVYDFDDEWGERSEFDVAFDAGGLVSDTYSERID
jgi:hypothetical protein